MATVQADSGAAASASECVKATAKLVRILHDSAAPGEDLEKLPGLLSSRLPNIRNTATLLHQMPSVVIALETHLDNAVRSAGMLETVKLSLSDGEAAVTASASRTSPP